MPLMMKETKTRPGVVVSSLVMIMALLWLTVSTPFVYVAKESVEKHTETKVPGGDDGNNPLTNTNEEKSENTVNFSEYLMERMNIESSSVSLSKLFRCYPVDIYFAFHPELISPPPEVKLFING